MSRSLVVLLLLLAVAGIGVGAALFWSHAPGSAPSAGDAVERIGPYPASQFHLEHDLFLPASDPKTVAARKARHVRPSDEVFGVVVGGQARAYPIYMISYHHVVNDVIQGIPVAITY